MPTKMQKPIDPAVVQHELETSLWNSISKKVEAKVLAGLNGGEQISSLRSYLAVLAARVLRTYSDNLDAEDMMQVRERIVVHYLNELANKRHIPPEVPGALVSLMEDFAPDLVSKQINYSKLAGRKPKKTETPSILSETMQIVSEWQAFWPIPERAIEILERAGALCDRCVALVDQYIQGGSIPKELQDRTSVLFNSDWLTDMFATCVSIEFELKYPAGEIVPKAVTHSLKVRDAKVEILNELLQTSSKLKSRGFLEDDDTNAHDTGIEELAGEIFKKLHPLSHSDRTKVLTRVAKEFGFEFQSVGLNEAPELWERRNVNDGENSIAFLRRVYAPWLSELGLSHLSAIDRPLYLALKTWQKRHSPPNDLANFFNSKSRRTTSDIDEELNAHGIVEPIDAYRKFPNDPKTALRLYSAALVRAKRRSPEIKLTAS